MALRDDLLKRVERKRQEIGELETQIKQANSYLQALEDTLKLLPREGLTGEGATLVLRPNSSVAKAREALKKAAKPLHVNEILASIGRPQDRVNRSGLNSSLSMYVRKGEIFIRTAPNTYGLTEFADSTPQPPEGFGRDEM